MRERRNVRRKRRDPLKQRVAAICGLGTAALVVILVCIFLFAPVFDVSNIVCYGNSKVSSDTIVRASGIETGKNIFLTSLSGKKRPIEVLDYIESCEISRVLPDTIKITVTERHPAAYFNTAGTLTVTDMSGNVLEVVSGTDAEDVIAEKITEKEEPSPSPNPNGEEDDDEDIPDPESTADGTIWGYDDDGDPIYRINGGHYEFDDDGNRFFVDDTPEDTPEPTDDPEAEETGDNQLRTQGGKLIYSAPVVYGIDIRKNEVGKKIESASSEKLESVLSALRALDDTGLLERTTKFDAEDINDVKFFIEDRLEVWFGSFDDFDYKVRFIETVIDNNLSKYERAILDFRDSKLYVRSANYETPEVIATPTPAPEDEYSEKDDDEDEDDEDGDIKSTPKPKSKATPKPTSEPDDDEDYDDDYDDEELED